MIHVFAARLARFAFAVSLLALSWPALSLPQPGAATAVDAPGAAGASSPPNAIAAAAEAPMALVLPLESPDYGRAADAVRSGFLAAAAAANVKPLVFAHGDGGVQEAFTKARGAGARVIVGPLLRDDVKWLALSTDPLPWTIALNQLDDAPPVSDHVVALALSIESEARQIARRAIADGAQSVAVVIDDTPLAKRFAIAFKSEWILQGGGPPADVRFDRAPESLSAMRTALLKRPADAVVLAVDARDAPLARPYLGQHPVYASSQVNDRVSPAAMRDLDDVRFVEVPWLADPDARGFAGIARRDYASPVLERLYALGIDAFRVARAFADGAPQRLEFDGATGHLSFDGARQFNRDGRLMQFKSGQIVPLDAR